MTFVPVPAAVEAVIKGTLGGENCYMTLAFTHEGAWGTDEMDELAAAIDDAWGTFIGTYLAGSYEYVETVVRDLRTIVASEVSNDDSAGTGGNVTGTSVANNEAIAVSRRSAFTGRSARGRAYFPVTITGNKSGANNVSTTFANAAVAVLDAIQTAADGVGWTEVVISRVQAGVPLLEALTYTIVEHIVVDTVVDSMRRRLPGRGS